MGAVLRFRPRGAMRALGAAVAGIVERLARLSGRRIGLALMYHRVGPAQGDPTSELVPPIGAALFEEQMRHVARRYRPVAASELAAAVAGRRRGEPFPVAVTFDDDDPSHTRVTMPILARTGVVATFYLNFSSTPFWWQHLQELWDRGEDPSDRLGLTPAATPGDPRRLHELSEAVQELPPERRREIARTLAELAGPDVPEERMAPAEADELARAGHEIGWHTRRHEPLPTLPDDELDRELAEGRDRVPAGRSVAYPHGKVDDRVAAAARRAGFTSGVTIDAERVTPLSDPMLLGRLLPSFDSTGHFALQLARRLIRSDG